LRAERAALHASVERRAAEDAERAALEARAEEDRRLEAEALARGAAHAAATASQRVEEIPGEVISSTPRRRRSRVYAVAASLAAGAFCAWQLAGPAAGVISRPATASPEGLRFSYTLSPVLAPVPAN
jgi:hypothetical protein